MLIAVGCRRPAAVLIVLLITRILIAAVAAENGEVYTADVSKARKNCCSHAEF